MTPPLETDAGLVERFHPDRNLPDCMMPDGGECCAGHRAVCDDWHKQATRIKSLSAELEQQRSIALSHLSSRKLWQEAAKENMERALKAEAEIERLKDQETDQDQNDFAATHASAAEIERLRRILASADATREAAVADEREHCARIAENFRTQAHIAHDIRKGIFPKMSNVESAIATAIRNKGV